MTICDIRDTVNASCRACQYCPPDVRLIIHARIIQLHENFHWYPIILCFPSCSEEWGVGSVFIGQCDASSELQSHSTPRTVLNCSFSSSKYRKGLGCDNQETCFTFKNPRARPCWMDHWQPEDYGGIPYSR